MIRLAAALSLAAIVILIAVYTAGTDQHLTLLVFVIVLGAILLILIVSHMQRSLARASRFGPLHPYLKKNRQQPAQFMAMRYAIAAPEWTAADLHLRTAPAVREVVASLLARHHGIALEHSPEQAHAVLGDGRLWEVIQTKPAQPGNGDASVWSHHDIEQLLDELEAL